MKTQFYFLLIFYFLLFFFVNSCSTYVVPASSLDGSIHIVDNNRLRFNYFEKFQSTSLSYSIYDKSRSVVIDNLIQPVAVHYGLNQIALNVNSIVNGTDIYTLEVKNLKGEKTIIRFK